MLGERMWRMSIIEYESLPRQVNGGYFPCLANRMLIPFHCCKETVIGEYKALRAEEAEILMGFEEWLPK